MASHTTKTIYKISDFLSWQRSRSLSLSPSFQRRSVWSPAAKSYFIDTIARGHPIPIVFLRERSNFDMVEPTREVVDGQQRIRTLLTYIEPELLSDFNPDRDPFEVKRSHNRELAGKKFSQLPIDLRRRILSYEFSVHVLPSDTDDTEVLQIFARMNATGMKLNHQELRNAEYYGEFKSVAYRLAYEQIRRWRTWGIFSEQEIARMAEVEETSDLIVMMFEGIHARSQDKIDKAYKQYEESFGLADVVERRFREVMDVIDSTLGATIATTVYSRKSMFNTLFTFYYSLMYGLRSDLEPKAALGVSTDAVNAARRASDEIQNGNVDEELAKVLRGATSHAASRQARLDFINGVLSASQA